MMQITTAENHVVLPHTEFDFIQRQVRRAGRVEPMEGHGMQKVTVKRDELLEVLNTNRQEHRAGFERAVEGYKERVVEELERNLADVRAGRVVRVYITLPMPEDHTKDYDQVIKMVEMSVQDQIELMNMEFQQFVMDDWAWKAGWTETANSYGARV